MKAPVILFVYNRVDNVKKSLSALSNNDIASDTELYIFSDGPKNENVMSDVLAVRKYINSPIWKTKFKNLYVIESSNNKGLANSIITGVDQIIKKYKKVIVLEDDCVSTPDFLTFMNDSLEFYEKSDIIWSIGGYSLNIEFPDYYAKDVYIMGRTCSYAWATWIDRWEKVDWEVKDFKRFHFNIMKRIEFDKYGMDRSKMLDEQQVGGKNSWAIRFCYAMFKNGMYTLLPRSSKISNQGYECGTHVTSVSKKRSERFNVVIPEHSVPYSLSNDLSLDPIIVESFNSFFKRNRFKLFVSFIVTSFKIILRK